MQDADWAVVTAYRILLKFSRVKVSERLSNLEGYYLL